MSNARNFLFGPWWSDLGFGFVGYLLDICWISTECLK